MRLARFGDGCYLVPGSELLWLELDGETIGVRSREIYQNTDGSVVPGVLESPVRTELRLIQYPGEPHRFQPLVCHACGDTGNSDRHTFGPCELCEGYADEKNLHVCALCGEASAEVLPVAPRATLNHELLLPRIHSACAIESLQAESRGVVVRASEAA